MKERDTSSFGTCEHGNSFRTYCKECEEKGTGLDKEAWRDVEIFEVEKDRYQVSDKGRVFDKHRQEFIYSEVDLKDKFSRVNLRKTFGGYKGFLRHNLIYQVFKPKEYREGRENKWQVLFKDGNVRHFELDNLTMAPRTVVRHQRKDKESQIWGKS